MLLRASFLGPLGSKLNCSREEHRLSSQRTPQIQSWELHPLNLMLVEVKQNGKGSTELEIIPPPPGLTIWMSVGSPELAGNWAPRSPWAALSVLKHHLWPVSLGWHGLKWSPSCHVPVLRRRIENWGGEPTSLACSPKLQCGWHFDPLSSLPPFH